MKIAPDGPLPGSVPPPRLVLTFLWLALFALPAFAWGPAQQQAVDMRAPNVVQDGPDPVAGDYRCTEQFFGTRAFCAETPDVPLPPMLNVWQGQRRSCNDTDYCKSLARKVCETNGSRVSYAFVMEFGTGSACVAECADHRQVWDSCLRPWLVAENEGSGR